MEEFPRRRSSSPERFALENVQMQVAWLCQIACLACVCLCESFPSTLGRNACRFKSMPRGPAELHFCFSSCIWTVFLTAVTDYFRGCNNVDGTDGAANGFFFFLLSFTASHFFLSFLPTVRITEVTQPRPRDLLMFAALPLLKKKKKTVFCHPEIKTRPPPFNVNESLIPRIGTTFSWRTFCEVSR